MRSLHDKAWSLSKIIFCVAVTRIHILVELAHRSYESRQASVLADCLSSQSEVAKPLAGRHAKSLTNISWKAACQPPTRRGLARHV